MHVKPIFHLVTLFARREAKTRIRQRYWLKLAGEKIRREQVRTVPTFFVCSREQIRQVENGLNRNTYTRFFFTQYAKLLSCMNIIQYQLQSYLLSPAPAMDHFNIIP